MRKPIALIVLLVYLAGYIMAVATISTVMTGMPSLAQLVFYIVAGFLWILPVKPLFAWMNSGTAPSEDA